MRTRNVLFVTAVVVVVSAGVLYTVLERRSAEAVTANQGMPMASSSSRPMSSSMPGGAGAVPGAAAAVQGGRRANVDIDVAAARLADRLSTKGGTGDEWALLARSYMELKRYPEAVAAYARARAALPGDASLVAAEAAATAAATAK